MGNAGRRRRWPIVALAVYGMVVLIVVLTPISYGAMVEAIGGALRRAHLLTAGDGWVEFVANVLMFVPLGFLLTLVFRHAAYGTGLALVLSAGVELVQIVIPHRVASPRDVLANTAGAALGAFLAWLIVIRRTHPRGAPAIPQD